MLYTVFHIGTIFVNIYICNFRSRTYSHTTFGNLHPYQLRFFRLQKVYSCIKYTKNIGLFTFEEAFSPLLCAQTVDLTKSSIRYKQRGTNR